MVLVCVSFSQTSCGLTVGGDVKIYTSLDGGVFEYTAEEYLVCFGLLLRGDTAEPALIREHEATLEFMAILLVTALNIFTAESTNSENLQNP